MTPKNIAKWSLTALLTIAPAFAQSTAKATIPFDFTVGRTKMAAGAYTVRFSIPGTVQLVRDDHKASVFVITYGVDARRTPEGSSLIFNRYGNDYFLSQVWSAGNNMGKQLPKSKPEIEIATRADAVRQASVPTSVNVTLTSSR